jgi:hypothetical protein
MCDVLYEDACFELGLEPLDEAGGFFSVIKRYFAGSDMSALDAVRAELAEGLETTKDKRMLLAFVDNLIEEAEGTIEKGVSGHAIGAVFAAGGLAIAGGLLTGKIATAVKVGSFFTPGGGSASVSTAFIDHAMTLAGFIMAAAGTAASVVSLISNLTKLIALKRGTVQEYLEVLRTLRVEVERAKVRPTVR